ncbi:hypothetical protein F2Q68_00045752 [Brassica cretica]|uniref:Retrotransposon gag domain-containing protein n=1 Tax=Brassica cretica TaxID=69181 RepID=A0A8S9LS71_BRACR|nr:hypothetical protein F2Q68_00045752 [Brassica cretica]
MTSTIAAHYGDARRKISTFRQNPRESFRNAWERFKSYQLECPHHGYSEPQLINTFYEGINLHYQSTLDIASEGNFSTRNPEEAKRLIKNIATDRSYEMMDIELGRKADPNDESPLLEIKEHLDSPHPALGGQNQFGIYQIDDDTLSELEQQIDFVDSYTLKNNYPNPDSFTHNYDATVGSCQGRAKSRLNQAFTGNRKLATDLNGKIDIVFSELMRKFDTLSVQIKRLDSQVAENTTAIKRETGRLAGRTDANPKRQVNAVLLRSGKRLIPRAIEINNTEKHDVVEETGESRSRPIDLDDPSTESGIPRERQKPNTEEEAIELEEEEGEIEEDAEIDRQGRTSVDRQTKVNIDRRSENNVDRLPTPAEPAIERVYRTLPPFPPNKTQTKRELDKAICKKAFDKITLEMPLSDAIKVIYHGFDPFSSMELKRDFIRADHWRSIRRRSNRSMHIQCRRSIHKRSLDD